MKYDIRDMSFTLFNILIIYFGYFMDKFFFGEMDLQPLEKVGFFI
jgi:hypothetical protein